MIHRVLMALPQTWSRWRQQGNQQSRPQQQYQGQHKKHCRKCPGFSDGHAMRYIMIVYCLIALCEGTETLDRINYGIMFQKESSVFIGTDYWLHTFELEYPTSVPKPYLSPCTATKDTCSMWSRTITQVNGIRSDLMATKLNSTLDMIKAFVPESNLQKSHSKHSLQLSGTFWSGLFETATEDGVNMILNRIDKLSKGSSKAVPRHDNHRSSPISTVNSSMDFLMAGIKSDLHAITHVQSKLHSKIKSLEYSFVYLLGIMVDQSRKRDQLYHELDQFQRGIYSLVQGKLSPLLIPSEDLKTSLSDIKTTLISEYSGFHLAISSLNDVYSDCEFLLARNGSKLYITLKLPVSHSRKPFSLYKISSFPVPINPTSADATQLLGLPSYFLISYTRQHYATLDDFHYSHCSGNNVKFCTQNIVMNHRTAKSCISSIFHNEINGVKSLCNFRYLQDVIKPMTLEVVPNSLLLYRTSWLSLHCLNNFPQIMSGCDFCLLTVPCGCSVSTTEAYVAPRAASCHVHSDNVKLLHAVNLAIVQHFFDRSVVQNIFADTKFKTPLNVIIPKIKIYEHRMSDTIVADSKADLSLAKIVKAAKKDEVVFKSLIEPLLENKLQVKTKWPDSKGILLLVTMAFTACSTVLLICTVLRVRKLSRTILLLQLEHQIKT